MVKLAETHKKNIEKTHTYTDFQHNKWKDIVIIASCTNNSVFLRTFSTLQSFKHFLSRCTIFFILYVS